MDIKNVVQALRKMNCEIAEVIVERDETKSFSFIVYLVSEPSNDDMVNPSKHDWIFDSIEEFEEKFSDCYGFNATVSKFYSDF